MLKRIFSAANSTPTTALYLETGCMRIGTTIKARRVNYLHYLVKLPEEEMLSRFFNCQWLDEGQLDWTKQVKLDLADFNLPTNLEIIRKKSTFSWKTLVKKRAKEFELRNLLEIKEEKNKSKMKNLKYEMLKPQEYLANLDVREAKAVFRFRVRMALFSGNFKGYGPPEPCPLCGQHDDLQDLCFQCPVVIGKLELTDKYENIYEKNISKRLARILIKIVEMRRKEE